MPSEGGLPSGDFGRSLGGFPSAILHPLVRLTLLLLVGLAAAAPLSAQTPCQNGTAGAYACDGIDLLARIPRSTFGTGAMSDIWGWTDPQTGREYAIAGYRSGTAFIDITVPTAPVYLGRLLTASGNSTWRDIKTVGDHAFIVSESSNHGMQVFDLTRLRNVSNPPQTFNADARFTGFGSAHNIVADETSGYVYAVGTTRCSGGLYIVDVRNPTSPTQAGCFSGDGYTHDAQCVTYSGPDTDYTGREICVAANEDTITIVDVTNKNNPVQVDRVSYPSVGYTHQGWFTDDQRYFIVNDETDEFFGSSNTRTILFDLSNLENVNFDGFYFGPRQSSDHNLYVHGDYAYLSNYKTGLRIVDVTGIASGSLNEVAFFDTYNQGNGVGLDGQWSSYPFFPSGTVVANDQENGVFVLRPNLAPPTQTVSVDVEPVGAPITIPASGGTFSYTASVSNLTGQSQTVDVWAVAILPNGTEYGTPVLPPRSVTLAPNATAGPQTASRAVPASAPDGVYTIELRAGDYPSNAEATDSFTFTKASSAAAPTASSATPLPTGPNPFADRTTIRFVLGETAEVRLTVFDVQGREVAVLVDGALDAGPHEVAFDGTDLPSGTYFAVVQAGTHIERQRLTLAR